jgi:alkanesulfonate monooxygenase SsuD/methylene tetrahydromethanopterin reductase-like flavin-dependent oxidoreductase (luciferase family)
MWTEERASFHGRYYSNDRAPCQPKPVQWPHQPIWIGGVRNRLLEVADWVNFSDFQITYVRCGERVGFLREGSPHFGRDPGAPKVFHREGGLRREG